jgi:hypothetical protein
VGFQPKDEKSKPFFSATIGSSNSQWMWMAASATHTSRLPPRTCPVPGRRTWRLTFRPSAWPKKYIYYIHKFIKTWYLPFFGQTQIISYRCLVLPHSKIPGTRKTWPFRSFFPIDLHLLVTSETHRRICMSSFGSFTVDSLTVGYARLPSSISGVYIVS